MTPRQLAEILAIIGKLNIESNPNLTREEKEFWKQFVDEIKKKVADNSQF